MSVWVGAHGTVRSCLHAVGIFVLLAGEEKTDELVQQIM